MGRTNEPGNGITAALLTPLFMGLAPILGKLAIRAGVDAFTLAALRTCLAAILLWVVYALFFRRFTYIFFAGLVGTLAVGVVNGLGSLLYYNGLLLLDNASLAQLLSMTYVIFAMLLTRIYGHHVSRLSILRTGLALVAVYLLASTGSPRGAVHWQGIGLMLGGAFLYALHVILSQRVMFEMPAPTMALYSLSFMGLTVLVARLAFGSFLPLGWGPVQPDGWWAIIGLMAVTALSRVTLFSGVRHLGGLQAILLNMAEIAVTLLVASTWLGERLSGIQWAGVLILVASVLLSHWDAPVSDTPYPPLLLRPSPFGGLLAPDQDPPSLPAAASPAFVPRPGESPPSDIK